MNNEFIITIDKDSQGNDLSLNNITVDAAESLKVFIESLTEIAKSYNNPEIKLALKDGSVSACMLFPEDQALIRDEIITGKSESNDRLKHLISIQDRIKKNGLSYSVKIHYRDESKDLTQDFKSTHFKLSRSGRKTISRKIEFIKGELFESGGRSRTNVHLIVNDSEVTVECKKEDAIKLNSKLYNIIYLSVLKNEKEGDKPKYIYIDSYASEATFNQYQAFYYDVIENKTIERFDIVYNELMKIVCERNLNELRKIIRLFNHTDADSGIIRAILMTIKPIVRTNENLQSAYSDLLLRLKLSTQNANY